MSVKSTPPIIVAVAFALTVLTPPTPAGSDPPDSNRYLNAVREFADNVLKYGRDTYGPKHTPLFVDGLMVRDPKDPNYGKDGVFKPVKWISPKGDYGTATETEEWILSNFASQQTLMRTLDGLSSITGDPKYRKAATDAIEYAFDHARTDSGLLYWGQGAAYDALSDKTWGSAHCFKLHYPYYELMWKVDLLKTKRFIEACWCAHVYDWSNLDFNRFALFSDTLEEPWNHEYQTGPAFFKSKNGGVGFFVTGSSLIQAGTTLYRLSRQEQPVIWSKRLAKRFVDTRHPNTGIGTGLYNKIPPRQPLGDDLKEHFQDLHTRVLPYDPFEEMRGMYFPEDTEAHDWISLFLVGEMLGEAGKEFKQWALEELTAWGKTAYRKRDNSFIPILTDGTRIEGYVSKKSNTYGPKGAVAKPLFANLGLFWAYAVAYRTTSDEFMWRMSRDIALGNSLGDIGRITADTPKLQTDTTCSDVYGLLGFLELYKKTNVRGSWRWLNGSVTIFSIISSTKDSLYRVESILIHGLTALNHWL